MNDEVTVTIRGETWRIVFTTLRTMPKKTWGDCDRVKKVIRVRKDLSPVNMLDTLIHEIRHAQHPILFEAEEFITDTSTEIAKVLLLTGFVSVNKKSGCGG